MISGFRFSFKLIHALQSRAVASLNDFLISIFPVERFTHPSRAVPSALAVTSVTSPPSALGLAAVVIVNRSSSVVDESVGV